MNTAGKTTTIREFRGGICEIEKLPDEPGRNWVKVRFDAQGGGCWQSEAWDDEMPQLEGDIQGNFSDISNIVGLPLAPLKKPISALPAKTLLQTQETGRSGCGFQDNYQLRPVRIR